MLKQEFIRKTLINFIALAIYSVFFLIPIFADTPVHFEHITQSQGLSNNAICTILQDHRGFLWIGTESGLNRYDGHDFKIYQPPSFPIGIINCLYEDREKNLWVGTINGGLIKYYPEKDLFLKVSIPSLIKTNHNFTPIISIYQDTQGILWIGTRDGLVKFDTKTNVSNIYFPEKYVAKIQEDKDGKFWLAVDNQITLFDPLSGETIANISLIKQSQTFLAFSVNNLVLYKSNLYIATSQGLYVVNTITKETIAHYQANLSSPNNLLDNAIFAMYLEEDKLWLGTVNGGLSELNLSTNIFTNYQHDPKDSNSLLSNYISAIYRDRSGVLWVGDKSYGLNKLSPYKNLFELYQKNPFNENTLSNNYIRGICEDKEGFLWVATQFGGLNKIDRKTGQIAHYKHNPTDPNSLYSNSVWAVYQDRSGVLWVGTSPGGLHIYDYSKDKFIRTSLSVNVAEITNINVIYEDHLSNLWVGSTDGLYQVNKERKAVTNIYNRYKEALKLDVGVDIQSIFEDSASNIWVGTNDGVLKFSPQSKQPTIYRKELAPSYTSGIYINSFLEDNNGKLWMSSKGLGLLIFDPVSNKFGSVSEAEGLPHINAYGMLSDAKGTFWISTDNGISHYDPKTKSFENFGPSDGLQGKEFNRQAFFKSHKDEFFFGGPNGLNTFYPQQITKNLTIPSIIITELLAAGVSIPLPTDTKQVIELKYTDKTLQISFAALDFNAPENNRYSHRLIGFDSDWQPAQSKNETIYTNLYPGTYIFQIKGTNNHQVWSSNITELTIVILPPPWLTTWAYLIYITLIISSIILFTRYQTNKLKIQASIQSAQLRAEVAEVEAKALERENQQRAQSEIEIKEKNLALEEANLKLKELDEIKARFTAMLVHDLKSPLTVVNSTLEILSEETHNQEAGKLITTSQKSVQKIVTLVNEVLEFYKADSQELKLVLEPINLFQLLQETTEATRLTAASKNISVSLTMPELLPNISGDEGKLERVFNNLLSNAIKFTPIGGMISIEVWTKIGSGVETGLNLLHISISDTGEGIASEELPYIFEPYHQAKSGKQKGGVGLGLSIVKRIIAAHSGSISARSQIGIGTCFTITLPALPITSVITQPHSSNITVSSKNNEISKATLTETNFRVKKILLVEDELINQKLVASKLKKMGYEVNIANNGKEAIEAVLANGDYDLILMDHYMPEMDGIEATQQIRRLMGTSKHIPIIAFSSSAAEYVEEYYAAGMDDFIEKPFNSNKLEETVKQWLNFKDATSINN